MVNKKALLSLVCIAIGSNCVAAADEAHKKYIADPVHEARCTIASDGVKQTLAEHFANVQTGTRPTLFSQTQLVRQRSNDQGFESIGIIGGVCADQNINDIAAHNCVYVASGVPKKAGVIILGTKDWHSVIDFLLWRRKREAAETESDSCTHEDGL